MRDPIEELTLLGDRVQDLASEYSRVRESVDGLRERLAGLVQELNTDQIMADLAEQADRVADLHLQVAHVREELWLAEQELARAEHDATYRFKMNSDINLKDPTTGRTNKDWTDTLLAQYLDLDDRVQTAQGRVHAARVALLQAQAELEGWQARLSATRHRARLLSSQLLLLAEPVETIHRTNGRLARPTRTEREEEI